MPKFQVIYYGAQGQSVMRFYDTWQEIYDKRPVWAVRMDVAI